MNFGNSIRNGFDQLTGRSQAVDAQKKQQALQEQARGRYDLLDTAQNDQAATGVMNRLFTGGPAQVDQTQFQREYVQPMTQNFEQNVMPAVNQSMGRNFWSSTRQQAQQNAAQSLGNQMNQGYLTLQQQADQNQKSALQQLLNNRSNQANALIGQAASIQATPSVLQGLGNLLGTGQSLMNLAGGAKALAGPSTATDLNKSTQR
jgi:hypothetical protein